MSRGKAFENTYLKKSKNSCRYDGADGDLHVMMNSKTFELTALIPFELSFIEQQLNLVFFSC